MYLFSFKCKTVQCICHMCAYTAYRKVSVMRNRGSARIIIDAGSWTDTLHEQNNNYHDTPPLQLVAISFNQPCPGTSQPTHWRLHGTPGAAPLGGKEVELSVCVYLARVRLVDICRSPRAPCHITTTPPQSRDTLGYPSLVQCDLTGTSSDARPNTICQRLTSDDIKSFKFHYEKLQFNGENF